MKMESKKEKKRKTQLLGVKLDRGLLQL